MNFARFIPINCSEIREMKSLSREKCFRSGPDRRPESLGQDAWVADGAYATDEACDAIGACDVIGGARLAGVRDWRGRAGREWRQRDSFPGIGAQPGLAASSCWYACAGRAGWALALAGVEAEQD
jgi:hypothetical protein